MIYSLLGVQLTKEEFENLIHQQSLGKELVIEKGKIIAVDHIRSEEEQKQKNLSDKTRRLEELTKDFAQVQAGFIIEDIEERKLEFQTLLNEVRVLQGKDPKQIQK